MKKLLTPCARSAGTSAASILVMTERNSRPCPTIVLANSS